MCVEILKKKNPDKNNYALAQKTEFMKVELNALLEPPDFKPFKIVEHLLRSMNEGYFIRNHCIYMPKEAWYA